MFQDQWLLVQGTEVQNKCAGNKAVRTCISRDRRDILWISWNIGCKMSSPSFARFREDSNLRRTNSSKEHVLVRVFRNNISQLCRGLTPTYHGATFNETLFERKCLQARFLVHQAKTRGRRASQGVVDTRTKAAIIWLFSDCQLYKSSCPNSTSFEHKRM